MEVAVAALDSPDCNDGFDARIARWAILLLGLFGRVKLIYDAGEFGEALEDCGGAEPFAVVEGGSSADGSCGGDVAGNSGLGGGDGSVADATVARDSDLAGEDDIFADVGRSGEADLRAE
jgi:hypothetical protein